MRRLNLASIPLKISLLISAFASCAYALPGTGSIAPRLACSGPETALVGALVYERDRGTPKEDMIAKAMTLPENDGTQMIALTRIDDVYLDKRLTTATVAAYRSMKCQRNLMLRDDHAYEGVVRERLLQCQSRGTPGDRKFGSCIEDLLEHIEERMAETNLRRE